MSPTSTAGLPPVIVCAAGALICCMSHWKPLKVSVSVAGGFGRSPGGGPASVADSTFGSCIANPAVAVTASTPASASNASRNDALPDFAIATPICG